MSKDKSHWDRFADSMKKKKGEEYNVVNAGADLLTAFICGVFIVVVGFLVKWIFFWRE